MAMNLGDMMLRVGANIEGFEKAMGTVSQKLNATIRESEKAFSGFAKLGSRLTTLGTGITAGVTVPILGAVAGLTGVGLQVEKAMSTIRAGTGATGEALKGLGADFKAALGTVPNDVGAVATVIADLNTRLGITGPPLQELSTQLLNLARISGTEVGPLIASSTRLFGDWSVQTDKQSAALDYMFRASQSTGIGVNRLMELVVQFGAPLRALGFSMEDAAALMGKWEKEGVNLETVLSGLRFALGNFAKAGKEPEAALKAVIAQIQGAKTESEATAIAFQTFGKRAAVDMSRAIIEGRFNIEELVTSLKGSKETINAAGADTLTFAEKMKLLKNEVVVAIEPLGTQLVGALSNIVSYAQPLLNFLSEAVKWFAELPGWVQGTAAGIAGLAAAIGPALLVAGQFAKTISILGPAFTSLSSLLGGGAGLAGLLSAATPLAIAFGAAIAAWAIYKAYTEMSKLNKELERLEALQRKGVKATDDQAREIKILEETLRRHRKEVDSTGLSVEEYIAAMRKAVREVGDFSDVSKGLTVSVGGAKKAVKESVATTEQGTPKVKAHAEAVKKGTDEYAKWIEKLIKLREQFAPALAAYSAFTRAVETGKAGEEIGRITQNADAAAIAVAKIKVPTGLEPDLTAAKEAADRFGKILDPIPEDYLEIFRQTDKAMNEELPKQENRWNAFGNQISTIFTDTAKSITDKLWDDPKSIGSVFSSMLDDMGKAATRFVVEYLEGQLFKALAKLTDLILPGIGKLFGSVFSFGGAGGGTAAAAGGGAGGAAIPGAGGLAGIGGSLAGNLSAVGALGSFATSIIGAFQMHGIGQDTGRIEENTRYTAIAMIGTNGVVDTMRQFLPGIGDIHEYLYTVQSDILAQINDSIGRVEFWAQSISAETLHWGQSTYELLEGSLDSIVSAVRSAHTDLADIGRAQLAELKEIKIRVEGGSARDRDFAENIIGQMVRQLKQAQLVT